MARKPTPKSHSATMGDAAAAALRQLSTTGVQSVTVDERAFAELQDQGPTSRAPAPYLKKPSGR